MVLLEGISGPGADVTCATLMCPVLEGRLAGVRGLG